MREMGLPRPTKELLKMLGYTYETRVGNHYTFVNALMQKMRVHQQREIKEQVRSIWKQYRQHRYEEKFKRTA